MGYKLAGVVILITILAACSGKTQQTRIPAPSIPVATVEVSNLQRPTAAFPTIPVAASASDIQTGGHSLRSAPLLHMPAVTVPASNIQPPTSKMISVEIDGADGAAMLPKTGVAFKDGMTAYDALKALAAGKLDVKASGYFGNIYVSAIGGLSEFDKGPMSGWLYLVNGNKPNVGAGAYKLAAGDKVLWKYTTDGKN